MVELDGLPHPRLILGVDDNMVEFSETPRIAAKRFFWPQHADELLYTKVIGRLLFVMLLKTSSTPRLLDGVSPSVFRCTSTPMETGPIDACVET